MNKFMDLEEIRQSVFRDIFEELELLHFKSQGRLVNLYYQFKQIDFHIGCFTRQWEYPWAIINSKIEKGHKVLDAGCGSSSLLLYLYKLGCLCYGVDNKFFYETIKLSPLRIKFRIAVGLSKMFPFYFWLNPHRLEGMADLTKTTHFNINYIKSDLTDLSLHDNTFDRIFCISVIEHLSREDMLKAAKEFSRVLKPQGLLIVTIDVWGTGLLWQDFIQASGLSLFGTSDFTLPTEGKYAYNVVGFVLIKQ